MGTITITIKTRISMFFFQRCLGWDSVAHTRWWKGEIEPGEVFWVLRSIWLYKNVEKSIDNKFPTQGAWIYIACRFSIGHLQSEVRHTGAFLAWIVHCQEKVSLQGTVCGEIQNLKKANIQAFLGTKFFETGTKLPESCSETPCPIGWFI